MSLRRSIGAGKHSVLHHGAKRRILLAEDLRTRSALRDRLDGDTCCLSALRSTIFLQSIAL